MKASPVFTDPVKDLWRSFVDDKSDTAREKLLIHYITLVKIIAGRMKVTLPASVEFNDLVSAGLLGLISSLDNFNPKRGFKFETYAAPRIKGAILDGLRDVDWLPRSYRQKSRLLDKTNEKLLKDLGRIPTEEEMATELKMSLDEYYKYIDQVGAASLVSLDVKISTGDSGDTGSLHDIMPDDSRPNPYDQMEEADIQATALKLIDELTEQERSIVALYYYENLTFREIGEVVGVSESRICQIHTRIISILRTRLRKMLE